MTSGIYLIANEENGKVYVGQSVDVYDRIAHHKSKLRHGSHENTHLQRAWNKYGEESFSFNVLEICDEASLDERERYFIREYKSDDERFGYNKESGGSLHKHMSEESKAKMSAAKQGMYDGEKNPMYGVHLKISEERKRKQSEAMSGENNPMYGAHRYHTDEERQAASQRFSGEGNPFYGKKHTLETKIKMRSVNKRKRRVLCVETCVEYESTNEAQRQTGIHSGSICRAANNGKTAGGYHWEFVAQ